MPLLLSSIALASDDKYCNCNLVTGVPISDYQSQSRKFEKEVVGNYTIKLSHKTVYLQITRGNALTFPEGSGAIWNELLDDQGQLIYTPLTSKTIAVLDIG